MEGYLFAASPARYLLFRRRPSRGRIWVPISGKVDPTDRSLSDALRRELREETGLRRPRRLFPLRWVFPFRGPDGRRWRLHAFGVEVPGSWRPRLSREHERWEWLELRESIRRLHYRDNRQALRLLDRRLAGERRPRRPRPAPARV